MWYTCYCEDQQITVADCHIVLVYLGSGTARDTKWMSVLSHIPPTLEHKNLSSDEEYEPEGKVVYDPEVKKRHTQSMGILSTEPSESSSSSGSESESSEHEPSSSELLSDTEPASEPEVQKHKPKTHPGHPRKPHIIKEKVYKIWRGWHMTWRWCTQCRKQFARQL